MLIESVRVRNKMFFTWRFEVLVNALEGFKVQDVGTPPCSVHEIDVVLEAWVEVNIILIVNAIESAIVLKIEFFSARAEAAVSEEVRDLKSVFFLAKFDTMFREPLRPLNKEICSVRLEAIVNETVAALKTESFFPRFDAMPTEAVRDWAYATVLLKSTAIATQATLPPKHSVFVTEVLPVLSNPDVVILVPVPVDA